MTKENNIWKNVFFNVLQATATQAARGKLRQGNNAFGSILCGIEGGLVQSLVEESFDEDGFLCGATGGGIGGLASGILLSLFNDDNVILSGLGHAALGTAIGGTRGAVRHNRERYKYVLPVDDNPYRNLVADNGNSPTSPTDIKPNCNFIFEGETARKVIYITSPYNSYLLAKLLDGNRIFEAIDFIANKSVEVWTNDFYKQNVHKLIIPDTANGITDNHVEEFNRVFRKFPYVAAVADNPNFTRNETIVYMLVGVPIVDKEGNLLAIKEPYCLMRTTLGMKVDIVEGKTTDNSSDTLSNFGSIVSKFYNDYVKNAGVVHAEITTSASAGLSRFVGANISDTFGIGFDFYGNVALYGNVSIYGYLNGKGFNYFDYKELFNLSFDDAVKQYNYSQTIDLGISKVANLNYDFNMDNLTDLFGLSTSASWSVDAEVVSFGMNFNYNDKDEFMGLGINFGVGIGSPISYTMQQECNKGVILSGTELLDLFDSQLDFDWNDGGETTFSVENNRLVVSKSGLRIKTNIRAVKKEDYIISEKAMLKYGKKR